MKGLISAFITISFVSAIFFGNDQILIKPPTTVIEPLDHGMDH
ncbi:hypothetical protein [Paenibacillus sp. 8b26]